MKRKTAARVLLVSLSATLLILVRGAIADVRGGAVDYAAPVITPLASQLCPGDTLQYTVTLDVTDVPTILEITESWCQDRSDGICSRALNRTWKQAVLAPRSTTAQATREIPDSPFFVPGSYVLWHAAQNGEIEHYSVPFTIKEGCP